MTRSHPRITVRRARRYSDGSHVWQVRGPRVNLTFDGDMWPAAVRIAHDIAARIRKPNIK